MVGVVDHERPDVALVVRARGDPEVAVTGGVGGHRLGHAERAGVNGARPEVGIDQVAVAVHAGGRPRKAPHPRVDTARRGLCAERELPRGVRGRPALGQPCVAPVHGEAGGHRDVGPRAGGGHRPVRAIDRGRGCHREGGRDQGVGMVVALACGGVEAGHEELHLGPARGQVDEVVVPHVDGGVTVRPRRLDLAVVAVVGVDLPHAVQGDVVGVAREVLVDALAAQDLDPGLALVGVQVVAVLAVGVRGRRPRQRGHHGGRGDEGHECGADPGLSSAVH